MVKLPKDLAEEAQSMILTYVHSFKGSKKLRTTPIKKYELPEKNQFIKLAVDKFTAGVQYIFHVHLGTKKLYICRVSKHLKEPTYWLQISDKRLEKSVLKIVENELPSQKSKSLSKKL